MLPTRCNQPLGTGRVVGFENAKWVVAELPVFVDDRDISTAYSVLAALQAVRKDENPTAEIPPMSMVHKYRTSFATLIQYRSKYHCADRDWVYAYDSDNELVQRVQVLNCVKPSLLSRAWSWLLGLVNIDANKTFQKLNESRGGSCFTVTYVPIGKLE